MTRWVGPVVVGALGGLGGCFSGDDFSACTAVGEPCGAGLVCVAPGRCEAEGTLDGDPPDLGSEDARVRDAEVRPPLEIINEIPVFIDAEGRDVRLLTGQLAGASVRIINARTIVITRAIDASGRGSPGGAGGGGGAAGTRGDATDPGQAGSDTANAGSAGGVLGGDGGQGSPGSRPGNAAGGLGGTTEQPDGQPGADAVFGGRCQDFDVSTARPGQGGGGGGGGRGSAPQEEDLCTGHGGGGGGVGGPGGGFLVFEASERIVVEGVLSARGLPAPDDGGAPGAAACLMCGECTPGAGHGGDGSADRGPGAAGGAGAGAGGPGGGGSGGMVLLQAPSLEFAPNTAIDVTGVGAQGGGLVALYGRVQGNPLIEGPGAGLDCRSEAP